MTTTATAYDLISAVTSPTGWAITPRGVGLTVATIAEASGATSYAWHPAATIQWRPRYTVTRDAVTSPAAVGEDIAHQATRPEVWDAVIMRAWNDLMDDTTDGAISGGSTAADVADRVPRVYVGTLTLRAPVRGHAARFTSVAVWARLAPAYPWDDERPAVSMPWEITPYAVILP